MQIKSILYDHNVYFKSFMYNIVIFLNAHVFRFPFAYIKIKTEIAKTKQQKW